MDRRDMLLSTMSLPVAAALRRFGPGTISPSDVLRSLAASQKTPGITAAIFKGKTLAFAGEFGEADIENHSPATPATLFRAGSISKLITAAAIMQLHQQDALDFDAPAQRYVPTLGEKLAAITIRQLLGHLSGIRHYGPNEYINRTRYATVTDALQEFKDSPLLSVPGEKYAYSSFGFNLLGAVIEGAARAEFQATVRKLVLDPLGITLTTLDQADRIVPGRSRVYSSSDTQIANAPYIDLSDRYPSGGFLSCATELAKFGAAHLEPGFLKAAVHKQVFTPQTTSDGKPTSVGFAWRIATIAGETVYHHGGDAIGGRAFLLLRPRHQIAVAITSNLSFAKIAETEAMALSNSFISI